MAYGRALLMAGDSQVSFGGVAARKAEDVVAQLNVAIVSPEREIWAGEANLVVAKTLEGELGIMAGHIPLLGVLVEGGVVTIRRGDDDDLFAAVHGGFLSVSDDQISILAEFAELGTEVDVADARSALEHAVAGADEEGAESEARRQRARLRAAGHED